MGMSHLGLVVVGEQEWGGLRQHFRAAPQAPAQALLTKPRLVRALPQDEGGCGDQSLA